MTTDRQLDITYRRSDFDWDISKYYKKGYTVPVIRLGAEATLTLGTVLGGTLYIDKRPDAEHEYSGILKVEPYVTVEVYGGVEGWNIEGGVDGRIKTQLHIPTGYIQVDPSLTAYVKGTLAYITTTFYEDEPLLLGTMEKTKWFL
jgi:hypothetical protein